MREKGGKALYPSSTVVVYALCKFKTLENFVAWFLILLRVCLKTKLMFLGFISLKNDNVSSKRRLLPLGKGGFSKLSLKIFSWRATQAPKKFIRITALTHNFPKTRKKTLKK